MPPRPPISKAELEVSLVLWDLGEATPRQVYEAYPNKKQVDFATVQTYLRRLEAKGYLLARRKGRIKTYVPRVRPSTVIRDSVDDFMNLLFDGEALPLLNHLIRNRKISGDDIERFRQMLSEYEDQQNESDDECSLGNRVGTVLASYGPDRDDGLWRPICRSPASPARTSSLDAGHRQMSYPTDLE